MAVVTAACFAPALGHQFITWDDPLNIVENVHYRGLAPSNLLWMFTNFRLGHYQPLTWLTFAVDYRLWGMDPAGYHLTNVLLHVANGVLVYLLALRLLPLALTSAPGAATLTTPLRLAAATAALFFAIHPLRVESVAWVSERRDVLSGFFYLLTVLAYLCAQESGRAPASRRRWRWASVLLLVLSLLSKAWGITLPIVLLVLDVYPLGRLGRDWRRLAPLLREKIPYLVPALAATVLAGLAQRSGAEMTPWAEHDLVGRLAQAAYGLVFYIGKTLLPVGLAPLYPLHLPLDPTEPRFAGAAVLVVAVTAAALATWRRWPWLLASWVCYAATVSPVLGLAQTGPQIAADRYTYLACLPLALLVGAAAVRLSRTQPRPTAALAAACLALLAALTVRQVGVWRDSQSFWNYALDVDPNNVNAYVNRGTAYEHQGDLERAMADYAAALELDRRCAEAYFGRANIRRVRGELDEALEDYERVTQLRPHDPKAYANRGGVRHVRKDLRGAADDYRRALELAPGDWPFRDLVLENLREIPAQEIQEP